MKSSKTGFWLIFRNIIPAVLITAGFFSCNTSSSTASDVISFEAMNTFMSIKSFGKNAQTANKAVKKKILETEKLISVTDSESQVYKINNSSDSEIILSEELNFLLSQSLDAASKTNGAFNPFLYPITKEWGFTTKNYHVPGDARIKELLPLTDYKKANKKDNVLFRAPGMQLDFGGIGKGYAGDLTINGQREDVTVLRNDGEEQHIYKLNQCHREAHPVRIHIRTQHIRHQSHPYEFHGQGKKPVLSGRQVLLCIEKDDKNSFHNNGCYLKIKIPFHFFSVIPSYLK